MKKVILHIDRLVLNGFQNKDRHEIAAGMQQELSRLLADPQAVQDLTNTGEISRIQVARTNITMASKPQHVGMQVARGIGGMFKK
jgi:hypothetical protein